jgi:hypothetical protein
VLSTPPAFVLSQDQTLQQKMKKENTPNQTPPKKSRTQPDMQPQQKQTPTTKTNNINAADQKKHNPQKTIHPIKKTR